MLRRSQVDRLTFVARIIGLLAALVKWALTYPGLEKSPSTPGMGPSPGQLLQIQL